MKYLCLLFAALLLFPSCALFQTHSEEYVTAVKEALLVSDALDANVGTVTLNNVRIVITETDKLIAEGKMTADVQKIIIQKLRAQGIVTKRQAEFIKAFLRVVLKDAEGDSLSAEEMKDFVKELGEISPEFQKWLDKLDKLVIKILGGTENGGE